MAEFQAATAPYAFSDGLLVDLLAVSLTGVNLLRPLHGPTGKVEDFAVDYLNPAGQRMTGLPEQPGGTILTRFPHTAATGIFDYLCRVYETGVADTYETNYQADGLDNYFHLAARRSGELLVVSFTDTASHSRTPVEQALREAQAAEKAARADADAQRQRFYEVLMALPAQIATYHGPDYQYVFANARYQRYFSGRALLGHSIREVMPEAGEHGVFAAMDYVYQTGEPYHAPEQEVWLEFDTTGHREQVFLNLFFYPLRDSQGRVDGLLDFTFDVTEQVLARRQVQQLNEELEARVAARTAELQAALLTTEQQREQLRRQQDQLRQILGQVPAAIAALEGADHRYRFCNDAYQAFTGGRAQTGLPMAQVLPEVAEQGFLHLLNQVYATGQASVGTEAQVQLLDADGQRRSHYIDFIYQPLQAGPNQPAGVLAFIVDVTEKVRARQQNETLQAELLAAARRQAHEREAFYQVFEQTPAIVALLRSPSHRYEYVNPAYQAFFPGRQLVGQDLAVAVPELVEMGFGALMDQVYQTGETYSGTEVSLVMPPTRDSPSRPQYFNFTYQAYCEEGKIAGVSVFAYDVTEQVETRRTQEVERQRLLRLFEEAPAGICILAGPELVFEFVNPGCQRLVPYRTLVGLSLMEALPELAGTDVLAWLRQVYDTGQTHSEQDTLIRLAPSPGAPLEDRYFSSVYQPRLNEQSQVDGVLAFVFEVTEQVRARQASEASARQLRLITDALPVLIGYLDSERRYRYANEAYRSWFNQDPALLLGRLVREVIGEKAYAASEGYMARALAGERLDFEAQMPYRAGFTKYIRTSYVPDVQNGTVAGFYTLVSDITEQVEARQQVDGLNQELAVINEELAATNEELLESNTQLTRTNIDLDNFIYTASHDLKAPISNIEGLLLALAHELPPAALVGDVPEMLRLMQNATERFKRTIAYLTDVSKLQKEHAQPATQVPLAALVEEVRLDLLPLVQQTQAHLTFDVPAAVRLPFSEKNLRSVVYNLLSNALKYRHPDRAPHVQLSYFRQERFHVLRVQDNGLGVDLNQGSAKLFGMFQRLHTHVEGSGIGLYMVKKIVENSGGRIDVTSQLEKGTTFTVFFPVHPVS
ncbi:PAS domain-containing sensor histidine kinase [Hymenobacter arizonensis]|uniref:histidine kinase n=1 Tax=Hymenobacter arizonensis TaxID=1227077 RepID=A0A1I5XI10_HYMAR|nr:PAS domain-containing protein [Hymenobacter arizonensis]SFQ31570.1 PAS domain S-box-containing protein [Hymenobacter arizonensis]